MGRKLVEVFSGRVNVLPIIARADSLTDEQLALVKQAVRDDLHAAGVGFGVFGDPPKTPQVEEHIAPRKTQFAEPAQNGNGHGISEEDEEEEEERPSRPVIKLRASRHGRRGLSRSRSRRDLTRAAEDEGTIPSLDDDNESVANVRFSAHIIAKADISSLLPFAVITPENIGNIRRTGSPTLTPTSPGLNQSEDGYEPPTPATPRSAQLSYLHGPPADLKVRARSALYMFFIHITSGRVCTKVPMGDHRCPQP